LTFFVLQKNPFSISRIYCVTHTGYILEVMYLLFSGGEARRAVLLQFLFFSLVCLVRWRQTIIKHIRPTNACKFIVGRTNMVASNHFSNN